MPSRYEGCRPAYWSIARERCSAVSKVPRIGILQRSWASSSLSSQPTVLSRRGPGKHLPEEQPAAPQPLLVDRVADTDAGDRLDRDADALEGGFRFGQCTV